MVLIDKIALMDRIAKECHYDTEHPLESYAKLVQVINDMEEAKGENDEKQHRHCKADI